MKQFYRLAALFLVLLLLCGCAAGNGYGKPERRCGIHLYDLHFLRVDPGTHGPVRQGKSGVGTGERMAAKARGGHLQAGAECF